MYQGNFIFLLSLVATAVSKPAPRNLEDRAVNCHVVNKALTVLKQLGPPATSFCRSYLHVSATVTELTTIATATVTVPTSTVTVEVIQTTCPAITAKRDVPAAHEKRINLPALSIFAAAKLSSGCKCLNLAPKTTTKTITPPATTVEVVATTTTCITCTPNGLECTFDRPDLCCGLACLRVLPPIPGGPEATCISF